MRRRSNARSETLRGEIISPTKAFVSISTLNAVASVYWGQNHPEPTPGPGRRIVLGKGLGETSVVEFYVRSEANHRAPRSRACR